MRGKVACADQTIQPDGITHAWAGKSDNEIPERDKSKDHPRMGGEKEARDYPKEQVWGSPPRRRGKVHYRITIRICHRITPA